MAYEARITRATPTCIVFLVDQSSSMQMAIQGQSGNPAKADFIADALNRTLANLVVRATADEEEPRRYYQVGVIGYGASVGSVLGDAMGLSDLVWIDELYQHPLRIEDRTRKQSDGAGGIVETNVKFPVWFDPVANGQTPMCAALNQASSVLKQWVRDYPNSYPPIVINLTDGEATDGDPRRPAESLKSLATNDGNVLLMTLHVSSNEFAREIVFPSAIDELPDGPSQVMFEMTSRFPFSSFTQAMFQNELNRELTEETRAMVYNASIEGIVKALDIGTRTAPAAPSDEMSFSE